MCHTPSSDPEDPPRWMLGAAAQGYPHPEDCYYSGQDHPNRTCHGDIITPDGGILQLIHHSMTLPDPELLDDEEQYQAAKRYIQERYGQTFKIDLLPPAEYVRRIEAGEPPSEVQDDMMDRIARNAERQASHYRDMIHRDPNGPDPLIEEPGP